MIAKLIEGRLIYADTDTGRIQVKNEYGRTVDLTLDARTAFPLDALSLVGQDVEVVRVDCNKFTGFYTNRGEE